MVHAVFITFDFCPDVLRWGDTNDAANGISLRQRSTTAQVVHVVPKEKKDPILDRRFKDLNLLHLENCGVGPVSVSMNGIVSFLIN